MTQYKVTTASGITYFSSFATQEAREKRRQVLTTVRQRRREQYLAFLKKRRLQAANDLATMM